MPEVIRFAKQNQRNLAAVKTAYFIVCLTMAEDTPENRKTADSYLDPLCEVKTSRQQGLVRWRSEPCKAELAVAFPAAECKGRQRIGTSGSSQLERDTSVDKGCLTCAGALIGCVKNKKRAET